MTPAEIAASALHAKWVADGEVWPEDKGGKDMSVADATTALKALTDAGWRIVRTETSTLDQSGELFRITEEWAGE
jgi:hypothetical protein